MQHLPTGGILPTVTHSTPQAQIRAALIGIVLFSQVILAIPAIQPVTEQKLRSPGARAEMRMWHRFLTNTGLSWTEDEFVEHLDTVTTGAHSMRSAAVAPLLPMGRWLGVHQSWGLFAAPTTFPTRLEVEIHEPGGGWRHVYRRLDDDYDEMASVFAYRRVRGLHDSAQHKPGKPLRAFCNWVAAEMFAAHPNANRVSVKMIQLHITLPGEPKDPKQTTRTRVVVQRDEIAP
ncbi:MAG: hypothetical protein GWP91_07250 [Rhodobacterales bacterium]|nr:hypothetical protein [Rhodobacterales bacterium]